MTFPKTKTLVNFLAFFCVSAFLLWLVLPAISLAAFTKQIDYQGKLTNTVGDPVADGDYDFEFKLYAAPTGGVAIWTETRTGANQVEVADGLFSVMLGEVASLEAINFDQALYLSVNFNSDGEMSPRKILGAVAAAFEANNALTFGGLATTSFLRSDASNASATLANASTTNLTVSGTGYLSSLASTFLAVDATGKIIATTSPTLSESDPIFTASFAYGIASSTNWDTAFNWGNHASAGYLTNLLGGLNAILGNASTTNLTVSGSSYLSSLSSTFLSVNQNGQIIATTTPILFESDPIFTASFAYGIASSTNWDTAFNWGNHASANYLPASSFNGLFDTRLSATTSLPYLFTLSGLATIGSSTGQTTILGSTQLTSLTTSGQTSLSNASTTNLSVSGTGYLSALGSTYLAVNQAGQIIATTTPVLTEVDPIWASEKSSYVPYTGATTNVNLGSNDLLLSGSLGVGTTSPVSKISVTFPGQAGTPSVLTIANTGNWVADRGVAFDLDIPRGSNGGVTGARIIAAGDTSTNQSAYLSFSTRNTSGVLGEKMRITQEGNVGIGTTSPLSKLHVSGTGAQTLRIEGGTTNSIDLIRTGAANNDWQILNDSDFKIGNGLDDTTFPNTYLTIKKVTGNVGIGITNPSTKLQVEGGDFLWNNNSASYTFRLTDTDGNPMFLAQASTTRIGIKTSSPAYDLDVTGYGRFTQEVIIQERLGVGTSIAPTYALDVVGQSNDVARFRNASLGTTCSLSSGTGIITCSSDLRLKKNITTLDSNLSKITALNPVAFNWLREGDNQTKTLGFIAQEVEQILPDLVITGEDGYKGLSMINMIPVIVGAIQEQQAQIQALTLSVGQTVIGQVIEKIEAVLGVFEQVKTKWLEVEEGVTIRDRVTGKYYCLYVEAGVQRTVPGRCEQVFESTETISTPPSPLPIIEVPTESKSEPDESTESSQPSVAESSPDSIENEEEPEPVLNESGAEEPAEETLVEISENPEPESTELSSEPIESPFDIEANSGAVSGAEPTSTEEIRE